MSHVVISHASADAIFAQKLRDRLHDERITVWMTGQTEVDTFEDHIHDARALVVIVSPAAYDSIQVTHEWALAAGLRIPIIPILTGATYVHPRLAAVEVLDFTNTEEYPWDDLVKRVREQVTMGVTNPMRKTQPLTGSHGRKKRNPNEEDIRSSNEIIGLVVELRKDQPSKRQQAAEKLGIKRATAAVRQLISLLDDPEPAIRQTTAKSLGKIKDKIAVPHLLRMLNEDDSDSVRAVCAEALWVIADPEAAVGLRNALNDSHAEVRKYAAYALGGLKDSHASKRLRKLLTDKDEAVRVSAATALGQCKAVDALDQLGMCVHSDDSGAVRGAAAHALGKIGDPSTVSILTAVLNDADEEVATAAAEALVHIGTAEALASLEKQKSADTSST